MKNIINLTVLLLMLCCSTNYAQGTGGVDSISVYQDTAGKTQVYVRTVVNDEFKFRRHAVEQIDSTSYMLINYYRERPFSHLSMITWEFILDIDSIYREGVCIYLTETLDTNTVDLSQYVYNMDTDFYYYDTFFVDCVYPASVSEYQHTEVQLYPNPASRGAGLHIEVGATDELKSILLLDLLGRPVQQWVSSRDGQYTLGQHIPSGHYLLRLISPEGILHRKLQVE